MPLLIATLVPDTHMLHDCPTAIPVQVDNDNNSHSSNDTDTSSGHLKQNPGRLGLARACGISKQ